MEKIRNSIIVLGHTINRDWFDYSMRVAAKKQRDVPTDSVYDSVMMAVISADVFIADVTTPSISIGHQITVALQKRKPVLVMQNNKNSEHKGKQFIQGSRSNLLNFASYTSFEDIKKIIDDFIKKYELQEKSRFNLVLTGMQNKYIEWASYHYKISKTDVIHQALEDKMDKDSNFESEP